VQLPNKMMDMMWDYLPLLASVVGGVFLFLKVCDFLNWFFVTFLRPAKDLKKLGSWAVVTGATDGIGKAIARQLAKKGLNIVLISRTQSKLDTVQAEIEKECQVDVKTISIDYSAFDKDAQDKMMSVCGDLEIGVLVNNVGISYSYPMWFDEVPLKRCEDILSINNHAMVAMTRLLVPNMLKRKKGTVVNLSSLGGSIPHQLMIVYGSSKAFVDNFTTNCQLEMGGKGLTFSSQIPMFVVSNMSKIRRSSLTVPTADSYAKASVAAMGYSGTISPYWSHAITVGILNQLPWWLTSGVIMNMHKGIRKKAIRKAERLAAKKAEEKAQ